MISKLRNIEGLSIQNLERKIDDGHRFIVYSYSISIILANISYVSPAYLLKKEEVKKHTLKYNTLSSILGWWSIEGIPNTIKSIRTNMKGGLDVTEDIMLNLNKENLKSRKVIIEELYTLFMKPNKSTAKDFIKAINKTNNLDISQDIYLGKFLNMDGSKYSITFSEISAVSKAELYEQLKKIFSPHVEIDIYETNEEDELNQKLIEQGLKL